MNNILIEDINKQYLQELFSLPFNTYQVADLDGMKIYTSNSLKRKYVEAMAKMDKTKPISESIEKLVEKSTIVPAWLNKGIFRLIFFKIFAPPGSQNVLGFYISQHDQIYLLVDNNITLGYASNQKLMHLTIHESMHMAAAHMKNKFILLFNDELIKFYSAMYGNLFEIEPKSITKEADKIANFIFKRFEFGNVKNFSQLDDFLESYKNIIYNSFVNKTKLDTQKFEKYVLDYIEFIKLYFKNINQFISRIRSYPHIYTSLLRGYKYGLGFDNKFSLCVQELFYPSEIICIYSEYTNNMPKVYRAFKSI